VNGKPINACTMVVGGGMVIENDTAELNDWRKSIIEMLFVEGNHICPGCEKSGNCELQALAYRFGMMSPRYPYLFPAKQVDGSTMLHRPQQLHHVRAQCAPRRRRTTSTCRFEDRGIRMRLAIDARRQLADTDLAAADKAASYCPTGSLVVKRVGWKMPVGTRKYDKEPIGSDIAGRRK
jgi:[NiFe] hydrogenase diaphorase moiety small subunit